MTDGGVLHLSENTSRHSPVWIKLEVSGLVKNKEEVIVAEKVSWSKSNDEMKENFSSTLANHINLFDMFKYYLLMSPIYLAERVNKYDYCSLISETIQCHNLYFGRK